MLLSRGDPFHAGGLAVGLDESGALELVVGGRPANGADDAPHRTTTAAPMRRWEWYFVAVSLGPQGITLRQHPVRPWPDDPSSAPATTSS